MKLLEYKAHELFQLHQLPAIRGFTASNLQTIEKKEPSIDYPVVIKAQVQIGGRGKAGGIQTAENKSELLQKSDDILGMLLKGKAVKQVFIAEKIDIQQEMYLSFYLDRKTKLPVMIFSPVGGVDINEIAEKSPDTVAKLILSSEGILHDFDLQYILDKTSLQKDYGEQFKEICRKLYEIFLKYDCLLAEINPLAVDKKGALIALDGKIDIDDNALFRHPEIKAFRDEITENQLVKEAREYGFLYIPIGDEGDIAVISNGSGMIMSSIDLISKQGMKVTCALDLGGGATTDRITEALRILASNPQVKTIFINIFGGITRCNEIAGGVEHAIKYMQDKQLVVRLEGTNKEMGLKMLKECKAKILLVDGLYEGVNVLAKEMAK